jgi:hypothetical protein
VGLHHSFHLLNPPAAYPLRVPIALALDNITEIAQNENSEITFHTAQGPVFTYRDVITRDARGKVIASRILLKAESDRPSIFVEVLEEGEFPLVIG